MAPLSERKVVIIGAGPAGLTAAYQLCKAGVRSVVLEKDAVVGGLSRTVKHDDFYFDIGGHRFFTKVKVVENMWREVLGKDFLRRQRLSRIYYRKKFFFYPLRPANALSNLGIWNAAWILLSYLWAQAFPSKPEDTFEQWVSNRFGRRLYHMFFKTYTEKVWGIPCREITSEWAAQRIKGLSLLTALKSAFARNSQRAGDSTIKTLIDAFDYPRLGPGQMWETVARTIAQHDAEVRLHADVAAIHWRPGRVTGIVTDTHGRRDEIAGTHFMSSMPIRELLQRFVPAVPPLVLKAAESLSYRDSLTVALVIGRSDLFPDNWIYVHDPDVRLGRIQNFKNWSPDMVPDQQKTCLGLEYFCFEGDGLWTLSDPELIALGTREIEALGLVNASEVESGSVVRVQKAYPVYDAGYADALATVRTFTDGFDNLQLVGRNGMHRYNNQDHSMLTAMDREGRSLEEQRSEATLARHSALGSRAATAPHQELPRTPAAAGCAQTVRGRREATGGVNTWGRLPDLN